MFSVEFLLITHPLHSPFFHPSTTVISLLSPSFFPRLTISSPIFLGIKNGVKGESGTSDDELTSDVLSHYSSASESTSVLEEGTGLYTKPDNACTWFLTAKALLTYTKENNCSQYFTVHCDMFLCVLAKHRRGAGG